jgi:hypothetical protein
MNNHLLKLSLLISLFVLVATVDRFIRDRGHQDKPSESSFLNNPEIGNDKGSNAYFHSKAILPDFDNPPTLKKSDIIYNTSRNLAPIVIEEYNTIFFHVAKAASSEWIRLFLKLTGSDLWCQNCVHGRQHEGLKYLSDYSVEEAQQMMTSPDWTRAIFTRHPKARILSAFLDKSVNKFEAFERDKCKKIGKVGGDYNECIEKHTDFSYFLHTVTTLMSENIHWRSIYSRVDEKWWPWINYVANMENLSEDAERFLRGIKSNIDGVSAWDRVGKTGWGEDEHDCNNLGSNAFLQVKDKRHKTNAEEKMRKYYTPELEAFVETHYADDLDNPYFKFSKVELFAKERNAQ